MTRNKIKIVSIAVFLAIIIGLVLNFLGFISIKNAGLINFLEYPLNQTLITIILSMIIVNVGGVIFMFIVIVISDKITKLIMKNNKYKYILDAVIIFLEFTLLARVFSIDNVIMPILIVVIKSIISKVCKMINLTTAIIVSLALVNTCIFITEIMMHNLF